MQTLDTSFNIIMFHFAHVAIVTMKTALGDWEDHEVGQYVNIRDHPKKVVEMLTAAGQYFYRQS